MTPQLQENHTNAEHQQFLKESEDFRKTLIAKKPSIEKEKREHGVELTLRFKPKHFLVYEGENVNHWDITDPDDVVVNKYTRNAWFYPYCTVQSTKERYHPAYKGLCPVLHNAPANPIVLTKYEGVPIPLTKYIKSITVYKYKNGALTYRIITTIAALRGETLTLSYGDVYQLTVLGNSRHKLEVNEKPSTNAIDLANLFQVLTNQFLYKKGYSLHKDYKAIHRLFDKHIHNLFSDKYLSSRSVSLAEIILSRHARLQETPELYDLPFNEIQLLDLYNPSKYKVGFGDLDENMSNFIESIRQPLRVGDTKKATDACFYGNSYPNSIKKLMLKTDLLEFPRITYDLISEGVEKQGVDRMRYFITHPSSNTQPDYSILYQPSLLIAFVNGWNVMGIKNMQKLPTSTVVVNNLHAKKKMIFDTVSMHRSLSSKNVPLNLPSKNINEIHDYLSPIYTLHAQAGSSAEMTAFKTVDTSSQTKPLITPNHIIRSPYTASELVHVGTEMKHCVASYTSRFYYRNIDIALLTNKDGAYLVCLEIKDNKVVQAKMKFNQPVRANDQYHSLVMDFIALNGFKVATSDIDIKNTDRVWRSFGFEKADEERAAIVESLQVEEDRLALG